MIDEPQQQQTKAESSTVQSTSNTQTVTVSKDVALEVYSHILLL
jgi:hypothetical protein